MLRLPLMEDASSSLPLLEGGAATTLKGLPQ